MHAANISNDFAREIEEGRIETCSATCDLNEKRELSSPTGTGISGATLNSPQSPVITAFRGRLQSWRTEKPKKAKRMSGNTVRTLEEHPNGYPVVSWFLNSDEQFGMYRKFGVVHARLLLLSQDEIREMETELMKMDDRDNMTEEGQDCLMSRENERDRDHQPGRETKVELLERLKAKTLEYGQLLMQAQALCAMAKPSDRDHTSVVNFLEAGSPYPPLMQDDYEFIYHKEDLVTLRCGREHTWLDSTVETALIWMRCRPVEYVFVSEDTRRKTSTRRSTIKYYTRSRINILVTVIIAMIILALLVLPIYLLYRLTATGGKSATDTECIGILLICTLIFSAALSLFTKAKRHEILAAAAGYCAVLVVFVGNVGNN